MALLQRGPVNWVYLSEDKSMKKIMIALSLSLSTLSPLLAQDYDLEGARGLYIGDSLGTGEFGNNAFKNLSSIMDFTLVSSCGSRALSYIHGNYTTKCWYVQKSKKLNAAGGYLPQVKQKVFRTPSIDYLMDKIKPQYIFIQLGTNSLLMKSGVEGHVKEMTTLLDKIFAKGSQNIRGCFWIGPPDTANRVFKDELHEAVYQALDEVLPRYNCQLIDSRKSGTYPENGQDGVHFANKPARDFRDKWIKVFNDYIEGIFPKTPSQVEEK